MDDSKIFMFPDGGTSKASSDVDGYDGIVFNRWYADMCRKGVQVDWYECR